PHHCHTDNADLLLGHYILLSGVFAVTVRGLNVYLMLTQVKSSWIAEDALYKYGWSVDKQILRGNYTSTYF
ncbi:hypothetical protein, partial [Escherichia coli]|uniref:hypothetical protein n=1 Tax=Escherichia coli TaxID=562 RepID=UPI001BC85A15